MTPKLHGHEFWVGAEVPVKFLEEAFSKQANYIVLGWVRSTHRIWIDDKLVISGDGSATEPITIGIPIERLKEKRPLRIAIQIYFDILTRYPDFLYSGVLEEGFLSYRKAASHMGYRTFYDPMRPFSLFVANALLAAIFFVLWLPSKRKQEYFYMAVYIAIAALIQVRSMNAINLKISPETANLIVICLRFYEGAFAMFLGFSFARVRSAVFKWGIPLSLLLPLFVTIALTSYHQRNLLHSVVAIWVIPILCSLGVVACLIQAFHLHNIRVTGSYLPIRINRLLYFAIGLGGVAALYWVQGHVFTSTTKHVSWERYAHLGLVAFMASIVFRDYQERELLMEKTPVSEYHRRPVLPMKISGVILVADLKSSEAFYRHRAQNNNAENIVSIWRSHFYTSIVKNGGTVLHKKGDEIIGFFDQDKCTNPGINALKTVDEMVELSRLLESDFRSRNLYPTESRGFWFRAAIATGDVRPIWEEVGGNREAYWEEAGTTTPFVQSNRLLDMERQVPGSEISTLTIMTEELALKISSQYPHVLPLLVLRKQVFKDKHGNEYEVAVYRPNPKSDERGSLKAA